MSAKFRKAGASLTLLLHFCWETPAYPHLQGFPLARIRSALQPRRGKFARFKKYIDTSDKIFRAQEIFKSVHKRFKH